MLAFGWCALAAASCIGHGYYDVALMVSATIGWCIGWYLGSRIGSQRGTAFLRGLFVVVGSAFALKLLLGLCCHLEPES